MTYEQIEREFDKKYTKITAHGIHTWNLFGEPLVIKSFLKQSFIKYLQSEVERLETLKQETLDHPMLSHDGIVLDSYNEGYEIAISDQITHITNQIKEIEV